MKEEKSAPAEERPRPKSKSLICWLGILVAACILAEILLMKACVRDGGEPEPSGQKAADGKIIGWQETEGQEAEPSETPATSSDPTDAGGESLREPQEIQEPSVIGHWGYTGYLDECVQWTDYESFRGCDYDGDGRTDRIYREYRGKELCDYRVEFGNGEELTVTDCYDTGFPKVQHCDLNGDGRQEILFTLSYLTSTDPTAFGDTALYEWTQEGYREAELPFERQEADGHTYCLRVDYTSPEKYRMLATVKATGFQTEVPIAEEAWPSVESWEREPADEVLWRVSLIQGENGAYLECAFSLLGKWVESEIIADVAERDGVYRIEDMRAVADSEE